MSIYRTTKELLNDASPNVIADVLRQLEFGNVLRALPVRLWKQVPLTSPTNMVASVHSITLPNDAKCEQVLAAYARTGTVNGALTPDVAIMTSAPSSGHIGHSQSGDLTFLSTDAITSVDVLYVPRKQETITLTLPVVPGTGVMTIPAAFSSRITSLISAVVVTPTPATCAVVIPSDTAPTGASTVSLNVAKTGVLFRIADSVTSATVVLGLIPGTDMNALLEAAGTIV